MKLRLILAVLVALAIIVSDGEFCAVSKIRTYMDTIISPFYFLSNTPRILLDNIAKMFFSCYRIVDENHLLRQELLLKKSELLMLARYKRENIHLRKLLNAPLHPGEKKMITQVIFRSEDPYSYQIVIDKGEIHGVYKGQPVINDQGIVGQVIAVSKLTSRVLLICDITHALPIQVLRNGIRTIATGSGYSDLLRIKSLQENIDIHVGDILVASGIGSRFPEGYPVAVITSIKLDPKRALTEIQARATAGLQDLRYLLLWRSESNANNLMTPEGVYHIANERLARMRHKPL